MKKIDRNEAFKAFVIDALNKRGRGSRSELARFIDRPKQDVTKFLNHGRDGGEDERRAMANFFNVDYESALKVGRALLEGREPPEPVRGPVIIPRGISDDELDGYNFLRIPFRDDMRLFAGGGGAVPGTYDSDGSPVVIHRDAVNFKANSKHLVAFRVGGDSMEPLLAEGGIVAVDTSQNDLTRLKEGDIYALCWDRDEECAVKRLRWAVPGALLAVESTNQEVNPTVYLEPEARSVYLIGRVVWACREF